MANIERAQNVEELQFRAPALMLSCALAREPRVGAVCFEVSARVQRCAWRG